MTDSRWKTRKAIEETPAKTEASPAIELTHSEFEVQPQLAEVLSDSDMELTHSEFEVQPQLKE